MSRGSAILTPWAMAAVALVWVSPAAARDVYVNNTTGDDQRAGREATSGDLDGPVRTLTRALQLAEQGDRVVIANTGEPYRESITFQAGRHSGLANAPFVVSGNGAVIDGTQPVPLEWWHHFEDHVFRFQPPRFQHQLLYLDGKPAVRRQANPAAEALPELQPLEWCLWQGHLYFRTEEGRLPQQYQLAYTALPVGITMYEVRHIVINDLVIQGFQLDGINAHDGVRDATLAGITSRGNARSGISVGGASRVRIESTLVGNNGTAQVRTEGYSETVLVDCDILDNTAPGVVREGGKVEVVDQ